jgi:twitching motility protein PilI
LNIRGQVIWVVDLGQFLGETIPLNTDRAEVPVIAIEEGDMMLGLAVARVAGMYWLKPDNVEALSSVNDPIGEFLRGEWRLSNNRILQLLDHVAILRSNRLGQSAG